MVGKQIFQPKGVKLGLAVQSAPEDGKSVSRGYQKIKGAADAFNFDFHGKVMLDIGSSTGGFTQYALDHGAAKVIAIEKGTNQMESPLRYDPRVDLHEKTDIFDVKTIELSSDGKLRGLERKPHKDEHEERPEEENSVIFDVIVADVSFVSLTKVLKHAKENLSNSNTEFLVMLKPQFEAKPSQLNNGVIKNDKIRREIIKNFESWLKNNGFIIIKKHDNKLKGKTGNQERFYLLKNIK